MTTEFFQFHTRYAGCLIYKASAGGFVVGDFERYKQNPKKHKTDRAAKAAITRGLNRLRRKLVTDNAKFAAK